MKKYFLTPLLALIFGFAGAWFFQKTKISQIKPIATNSKVNKLLQRSNNAFVGNESTVSNFRKASKTANESVVYIKSYSKYTSRNPFSWFFDSDPWGTVEKEVSSSGSGVIISKDGYIVTNNHVIDGADRILVILNGKKREFKATIIGKDPSTDLALIKIDKLNLSAIHLGNSDDVFIGDWVLAVGNPFNLTSTVTAGIVSAKGRNINIVNNKFPIESFIQTDAAINPGNSGGALVNTQGDLIGINTAIASKTGSYSGYGFAIPVNIVAKIVKDFIDFGTVQRGFSGMVAMDINAEQEKILNRSNGVVVESITEDGPADEIGIKSGDLIISINGKKTDTKAMYEEQLAYYRPGDKINVEYISNKSKKQKTLKLINETGNTKLLRKNIYTSDKLGADMQVLTPSLSKKLGINGVRIDNIKRGGTFASMGLHNGFIITKYNGKIYKSAQKLENDINNTKGKLEIEGIDANGSKRFYSFYYR